MNDCIIIGKMRDKYVVFDLDVRKKTCIEKECLIEVISLGMISVRGVVVRGNNLVFDEFSESRLPEYDINGIVGDRNRFYIISKRISKSKGELIRFTDGKLFYEVPSRDILPIMKVIGVINAKVVNKNGKDYLSAFKGKLREVHTD